MTETPRPPIGSDEFNGFAPERQRVTTTHDLSAENAALQARVAELEAERDEVCARGMAAGQAAMPTGTLTVIDSPELAELRARAESAVARERALLASSNDTRSALDTAEMNCRSLEAMTEEAIHRMDAAQAEVKRLRALAIDIVASYPAERHGSLPLDPHKAAAQVRDELVATLTRALSEGGAT